MTLATDRTETHDLASRNPETARELAARGRNGTTSLSPSPFAIRTSIHGRA